MSDLPGGDAHDLVPVLLALLGAQPALVSFAAGLVIVLAVVARLTILPYLSL